MRKATHWVLIEYSWPMLPKELRTYLLCENHMIHARQTASDQMARFPETGIKIVEHGRLESGGA